MEPKTALFAPCVPKFWPVMVISVTVSYCSTAVGVKLMITTSAVAVGEAVRVGVCVGVCVGVLLTFGVLVGV